MKITSFGYKKRPRPRADLIIDARHLPNPYTVPALRPLDGNHPRLQDWLLAQPGVAEFIDTTTARIQASGATTVAIGCNAGRHRSVAIATIIGRYFDANVEHAHLTTRTKSITTERGYGWDHQRIRKRLLHNLHDGAPCWWCGQPMYRDKAKNWDGKSLAADHTEEGGARQRQAAERLLHGNCNSQRQDGRNDHLRPAATGRSPREPLSERMPERPTIGAFTWH